MGILDQFMLDEGEPNGGGFMEWLRQPSTMSLAAGLLSEPDNLGRGLARGMHLANQTILTQDRVRENKERRRREKARREALYGTPWTNPDTGITDPHAGGMVANMDPRQQMLAQAFPDEFGKAVVGNAFGGGGEPIIREFKVGDSVVTRQYDPSTRQWIDMERGPRYKPETTVNIGAGNGGPFGGTSMEAQALNVIAQYELAKETGQPVTPEMEKAYELATQRTRPPTGEATALANIGQVEADLEIAERVLFPDGNFDRSAASSGISIGIPGTGIDFMRGVPGSEGRTARQAVRRAVEVLLRMRTGAAAPDQEVTNYMDLYYPSPADSDEAARVKIDRIKELFSSVRSELNRQRPLPGEQSVHEERPLQDYKSMYGLE